MGACEPQGVTCMVQFPAVNLCCEPGVSDTPIPEKPPSMSPSHRAPQFPKNPAQELEHLVRISAQLGGCFPLVFAGGRCIFLLCAFLSLTLLPWTSVTCVLLVFRISSCWKTDRRLRVNHSQDRQQLLGRKGWGRGGRGQAGRQTEDQKL